MKIKTMVLSNGKLEQKEINNTLEELQSIVKGHIEIPYLSRVFNENEIDIIINEEGKFIDGLIPEIAIVKRGKNTILDIVYGNCIFASHDTEGDTVSLNDEQINIIAEELKNETIIYNQRENKEYFVKVLFV